MPPSTGDARARTGPVPLPRAVTGMRCSSASRRTAADLVGGRRDARRRRADGGGGQRLVVGVVVVDGVADEQVLARHGVAEDLGQVTHVAVVPPGDGPGPQATARADRGSCGRRCPKPAGCRRPTEVTGRRVDRRDGAIRCRHVVRDRRRDAGDGGRRPARCAAPTTPSRWAWARTSSTGPAPTASWRSGAGCAGSCTSDERPRRAEHRPHLPGRLPRLRLLGRALRLRVPRPPAPRGPTGS